MKNISCIFGKTKMIYIKVKYES